MGVKEVVNLPADSELDIEEEYPEVLPNGDFEVVESGSDAVEVYHWADGPGNLSSSFNRAEWVQRELRENGYDVTVKVVLEDESAETLLETLDELPLLFSDSTLESEWDHHEDCGAYVQSRVLSMLGRITKSGQVEADSEIPKFPYGELCRKDYLKQPSEDVYLPTDKLTAVSLTTDELMAASPRAQLLETDTYELP